MNNDKNFFLSDGLSLYGRPFLSLENDGPIEKYDERLLYPVPFRKKEDGDTYRFCFLYPNAKEITLFLFKEGPVEVPMVKENDVWVCDTALSPGVCFVLPIVDGNETIYPGLPVSYSQNRIMNYIVIPDENPEMLPTDAARGSIVTEFMNSRTTGKIERLFVYLPPEYYTESERSFPVLYLQHGHGDNETSWVNGGKINFTMDNLISQGKAVPFVVVMCNGMLAEQEPGYRKVQYLEGFESFLIDEVLPYVESRYRILKSKENRAMAGFSLGSIQTSFITLRHQDLFSAAGLFSGFFQDPLGSARAHLTEENLATYAGKMKLFFRGIGKEDPFRPFFLSDDELLEKHAIPAVRRIYDGGHEWKVCHKEFCDFAEMIFKD